MKKIEDKLSKYLEFSYPIEILKLADSEGGGFIAEIPFLGRDAFTGQGETIDEALKSLQEVKEFLFEDYLKNNIEIPLPPKDEDYSGKFVVRVPKYLHRELVEKAKKNGVSLNTYCIALLGERHSLGSFEESLSTLCADIREIKSRISYKYEDDLKRDYSFPLKFANAG